MLRFAWPNQQANKAQTYLGPVGDAVVGYYTLAAGQVTREKAPERLTKGPARHPVPILLLARLAVSGKAQGQGIGKGLLRDTMQLTLQAADIAGIRAFAVRSKDEEAGASIRTLTSSLRLSTQCTSSYGSRMCGDSCKVS